MLDLDEEQRALQSVARSYAREKLASTYLQRARTAAFPWEVQRQLGDLGFLGLLAGPEWGAGEGLDYVACGVVMEELAYADFNVANCVLPTLIITAILREHGSKQQREKWMPALVAGDALVALALTEPGSGSDAAAMRTVAERTAEGWVLRGEKTSITAIPYAEAAIVFARTAGGPAGSQVSAFLVPLDLDGVTTGSIADPGWLPVGRGTISFDDVRVPLSALVGEEGAGFRTVMNNFDFTRPLLALTAIGAAQASLDETVGHVRTRPAFGSTLSRFEGISFPLAEHATWLELARMICYRTLEKRGRGLDHTADAAMCKWVGPLVSSRAIHDCLLQFGHYGYSSEYPLEQRLRDVLAVEIADGTAQIQKIVIARELFGRDFVPYQTGHRTP
ncbi:acyl-CoA dehydrogenase family protein [Nocardioides zeae]|nr:acyl-CoA dehydrogenase [Nocardioides zeae]